MFVFICCLVCCSTHIRGGDVFSSSPLFRYIEEKVRNSGEPTTATGELIAAYSSITEFQRDILWVLQHEDDTNKGEVLRLLIRISWFKEETREYDSIRQFLLTPSVFRELRLLNEKEPQVLTVVIGQYGIHPLQDIVFENTTHNDPWVKFNAYSAIGYSIGKYDKRRARDCLLRGLKDEDFVFIGHGISGLICKRAADTCVELGGRFRLLLWFRAPEYRYKLREPLR